MANVNKDREEITEADPAEECNIMIKEGQKIWEEINHFIKISESSHRKKYVPNEISKASEQNYEKKHEFKFSDDSFELNKHVMKKDAVFVRFSIKEKVTKDASNSINTQTQKLHLTCCQGHELKDGSSKWDNLEAKPNWKYDILSNRNDRQKHSFNLNLEENFLQAERYLSGELEMSLKGVCKNKSTTMTSMLPRITPASTPLPTGITQPPPRSHSSVSLYVPYPPKELSSSFDFIRIPQRINPLAPPPLKRRINWSWETTDQHYENEKRSLLMQKREHTRYHSAWSKAFYGAPAEKEAYRRHFREVLKQQMDDRDVMERLAMQQKIQETERAIAYDRECRLSDAQEYFRKHSNSMKYRDCNKQQMEERWASSRYNRDVENRIDRERLLYNPINWSCTLK